MKEYKFKLNACLILLLLLISFSHLSIAQATSVDSLKKRIIEVEEAEKHRDRVLDDAIAKYNRNVETVTKDALEEINQAKKTIDWVLKLGIPLTLLAFGGAIYKAYDFLKKYFEKRVSETIDQKWLTLQSMMLSQDNDNRLREQKKVLFLSVNDSSNTVIRNQVVKMRFKHTTFRIVNGYEATPAADLIVFNDINGDFPSDLIREYVTNCPADVHFVIYTNRRAESYDRTNFANSKYTLFNSVLGTLKYSEILNSN